MAEGSGIRSAAVDLAPLPWKSWGECLGGSHHVHGTCLIEMFLNLNHHSFDSSPLAEGSIGGCGYASPKTVADFGIFSGDCVILQANRNKWVLQVLKDTIHVPLSPTSVYLGTEPRAFALQVRRPTLFLEPFASV